MKIFRKTDIFIQKLLILCCAFSVLSCSSHTTNEKRIIKPGVERAAVSYLNEDYARLRGKQVSNVSYKLSVGLSASEPEYSGSVEIDFDLLNTDQALTIDFSEGTVLNVILNGKAIPVDYNKWFITIEPILLKAGRQHIVIDYSHPYSKTGSGLYRFTDPEDQRVYIYSELEPYNANRIFPSFDQPNIKATYELKVEAPADWQVVSSIRETNISGKGGSRTWTFPPSAKFSTYIFSLHAGHYHIWEADAGDIPMRLMARQSLAKYVDTDEWFTITRQGLEFFQNYFDIKYPFRKYDQLIVPDFNWGAMEDVAAVTFSEDYIKRGSYTLDEKENIASVILHEMAHMWFGDLVTMEWWNGLWLNESFATYMSNLALTEGTAYTQAWHTFYSRTKLWAYDTDEQVTNHPIELPVDNTDSGFANFDGITYGKGASVLKQLSYLLGPEVFRRGVSQYLKHRAYQNSELHDFTSALATAADRDLQEWSRQWLYSKGTNSISAGYQCQNNRLTGLHVSQQSAEASPELREHRLQLGFYTRDENEQMKLMQASPVSISGENTELPEFAGMACADFVYPNHADWAFVKVQLPEKELALLRRNINGFEEPLMRSMLWRNLWEAVRDARLPLTDYADMVLANIAAETNAKTLRQVLRTLRSTMRYFYSFQFPDDAMANSYVGRFEKVAWDKINSYSDQGDLQKIWLDHFLSIAHSPAALAQLKSLLNGELSVPGLVLDQDRRWTMVKRLSAHAYTGIEAILQREQQRDPSGYGEKAYIAAQASAPQLENKQLWLQKIQDEKTELPLAKLTAAMSYLLPAHQIKFRQELMNDLVSPLTQLDSTRHQQYLMNYVDYLLDGYCTTMSNQLLQQAVEDNQASSLIVTKALKIALQEDQRCLNMKALITP